jgi:hypothetical protein
LLSGALSSPSSSLRWQPPRRIRQRAVAVEPLHAALEVFRYSQLVNAAAMLHGPMLLTIRLDSNKPLILWRSMDWQRPRWRAVDDALSATRVATKLRAI